MLAAKPTTDPMTTDYEPAATYGWTREDRTFSAGARLKGLPVNATSCASLGLQTNENSADLTSTWDNEGQAAKLICVVELDTVGGFGRGDAGGAQVLDAMSSQDMFLTSFVASFRVLKAA